MEWIPKKSAPAGIINEADPAHPLSAPIIERNSILPSSKSQQFCTVHDNQDEVCVEIYQGESRLCEGNQLLGKLHLKVPPAPKGKETVDVRFTYDINGILEVEVSNQTSGRSDRTLIVGKGSAFDEEETARRLKELSALKINPRDKEENRLALARGERLYQEALGDIRERVSETIAWFESILASQESLRIAKARKKFLEILDILEAGISPELPGEFWEDEE